MRDRRLTLPVVLVLFIAAVLGSCSTNDDRDIVVPVDIPAASMSYIVLAGSDQGVHAFNPTYDREVLSPPYNNLWAQVVKRGDPPEIVTTGITLEYRTVGNTFSYGKATVDPIRDYAQFWDRSLELFGVSLAPDTGLNFVDPEIHNGLAGTMLLKGDRFEVNGIPVVPIDDTGAWDAYQVAEVIVRNASNGAELARTQAVVPTSDEISCTRCHGQSVGGVEILSVLAEHDEAEGTTFATDGVPVLCADCHGSPALGQTGPGSSEMYLSAAIHKTHSSTSITCYNCHPGETTQSSRSLAHGGTNGNCVACHGAISSIASTIFSGRIPWQEEPKCSECHTLVADVDTGSALYSSGVGHGGIACVACHGSPHAEVPSLKIRDNYQAVQYQGKALPLGDCKVCHDSSKGGGLMGIVDAHGGDRPTACAVCHTGPIRTTNPVHFPHQFQQRNR